jgi:hypothetical protein
MYKTMMKQIVFFLITLSVWHIKAQSVTIPFNPEWLQSKNITIDGANIELLKFKGALYDDAQPGLPVFLTEISVDKNDGRISIEEVISEPISWNYWQEKEQEKFNDIQLSASVEKEGNNYFAKIILIPLFKKSGQWHKITSARIVFLPFNKAESNLRNTNFKQESVLKTGNIFQLSISQKGVYQIKTDFIRSQLKLDPATIDPKQIKLYAGQSGMLPFAVNIPNIDDLEEIPIKVFGEDDGKWDPNDYIVFYAEGANTWIEDIEKQSFTFQNNFYSNTQFLYLILSPQNGKRIINQKNQTESPQFSKESDQYNVFEEEKINLLEAWESAEGSGNEWYGDLFKNAREYKYNNVFTFPGIIPTFQTKVNALMVLRSLESSSFNLTINDKTLRSNMAQPVNRLDGEFANIEDYVRPAELNGKINLSDERINLTVSYPFPTGPADGSQGWLDYVEINTRCINRWTNTPLYLSDWNSLKESISGFSIENTTQDFQIWDISKAFDISAIEGNVSNATLKFSYISGGKLKKFVVFKPDNTLPIPVFISKIANQNIHASTSVDMVIICPSAFEKAAKRLAEHRIKHSNLKVSVHTVESIYNEFSSGKPDPTAIRNFARMVYQRGNQLQYILLMGDGSYDHRNINKLGNNFIPTFQRDAYNPLYAFPSDDYYGILETTDNTDPLTGRLLVSVGRLPISSLQEAELIVDKLIRYDKQPEAFDHWRNKMVFVADDEDGNLHLADANEIADKVQRQQPTLNMEKIFLDAFTQVSTSGGNRFPEVTESINQSIFRGALTVTYLGHGSPKGWAQERVLSIPDILNWQNRFKMPLFITATCSFTAYDDPAFVSAGEEAFLNPNGGAIGLLTTTRAVFANQNAELTDQTLQSLFKRRNGGISTIGAALKEAKNNLSGSFITINSRKYTLIGDPSQKLAIPLRKINTTSINSQLINAEYKPDTLGALSRVQITGVIVDEAENIIEDFNGFIKPSVFDKAILTKTLAQDNGSYEVDYLTQKNIIFSGNASVTKGKFSFSFIIPKDINYQVGNGKISYYSLSENKMEDAGGYFNRFFIGGTSSNNIKDDKGPEIDLFLNSTSFVDGGLTHPDPVLIVHLMDENGINVVGNSIGHDIEAILDDNSKDIYVLNDFYTGVLDAPNQGEIRFPFKKLSEGSHKLSLKAWDVANNANEEILQFVVSNSASIALKNVLNYPNPFTDNTCFQFNHSLGNIPLDVKVDIYTITGQKVKSIEALWTGAETLQLGDCISWDGNDDFGDPLARGIYLYRISVSTGINTSQPIIGESKFEKLVILK